MENINDHTNQLAFGQTVELPPTAIRTTWVSRLFTQRTEADIAATLVEQIRNELHLEPLALLAGTEDHLRVLAPRSEQDDQVVIGQAAADDGDIGTVVVRMGREPELARLRVDPIIRSACADYRILLLEELDTAANPALAQMIGSVKHLIVMPLFSRSPFLGAAVVQADRSQRIRRSLLHDLWELTCYAGCALQNVQLAEQLEQMTTVDEMTRALTRRAFEAILRRETTRALQTGSDLSLLLIDVRGLRRMNEDFGHFASDDKLRNIAACLSQYARDFDVLARYGGDKFVLLLPSTGRGYADSVAKAIEDVVASMDDPVRATVTAAVATLPADARDDQSLQRAVNNALALAKERRVRD